MITTFAQKAFRTSTIHCKSGSRLLRRRLSALSQHSCIPATLYRLNEGPRSNLFDFAHQQSMRHRSVDDGQILDSTAMISPMVCAKAPFSNGAILMPNTFMMQEIIRQIVDQYFDGIDEGLYLDAPVIFTLAKGTQLPKDLILIREYASRFSLQPSRAMSLDALNALLDQFYAKNAVAEPADEWLDSHDFNSALADGDDAEWLEKWRGN